MTNQFTDEQVKSALDAFVGGDFFTEYPQSVAHWEPRIRAALEAAAGVAPQAPSERTPEFESREQELFKHQPVLSMKDGGIAGCKCMDRVFYNQTEDWGTHLAEVFDALAAPVQPSSTVNEAAITEVINQTIEAMPHARRLYPDVYASEVARAVVEAIGGESR